MIVKCKCCEIEFDTAFLRYKDVCPNAYCYSRGQKTQWSYPELDELDSKEDLT